MVVRKTYDPTCIRSRRHHLHPHSIRCSMNPTSGSGFEVQEEGVLYWAPNWSLFIPFGRDKDHRAGGPTFRSAAQEQERRADQATRQEKV